MTKIAILGSRGIPASYGGFETFAEQLSIRLVKAGIGVTVFCEKASVEVPTTYHGVHLQYINAPNLGPLTTLLFDIRCLIRARRSFDVVYMLGYPPAFFCWIPRIWGTAVWINMDGLEWKRSKWNIIGRTWMRLASWFSKYAANRQIFDNNAGRIAVLGPKPPATSSVIQYGATIPQEQPDPEFLKQYGLTQGGYHLVVCRIEPENHVLEIIRGAEAANILHPLIVVGGLEADTRYIRQCLAEAGACTRLIGAVYQPKLLQALRYYCMTYVHGHSVGGTNPSLIEALACGNVIISHDNSFNREVLQEKALYFHTEEDLRKCLIQAEALSSEERRDYKMFGIERVQRKYNWERIAEEYKGLLSTLAATNRISEH